MELVKQNIINDFNRIEDMTFIEIEKFLHMLPIGILVDIEYSNGCIFSVLKKDNYKFINKITGNKNIFMREIMLDTCVARIHLDINYNHKHKYLNISIYGNGFDKISRTINTKFFKISYDE